MIDAEMLITRAFEWIGAKHGVKCCVVIAGEIDEKGGMEVSTSSLAFPDHARTLFHMALNSMAANATDERHRSLYQQLSAMIELFEAENLGEIQ